MSDRTPGPGLLGWALSSGGGAVGKRPTAPRDPQRLGPSSQSGAWPGVSLCPLHAHRRTWNPPGLPRGCCEGRSAALEGWCPASRCPSRSLQPQEEWPTGYRRELWTWAWDLLQPLTGRVAPSKLPDSSLCLTYQSSICPRLTHVSVWQKPLQRRQVISLQLKYIN